MAKLNSLWSAAAMGVLVATTLHCASGQAPSIEANGRDITLNVPDGANVAVKFIGASGAVVRTEQVATQAYVRTYVTDAVANAQATLSEWVQGQIDGLEASKADAALTNVLQAELEDVIRAIGRVEGTANSSSAIDQAQAACHNEGSLYNITSGQCQRIVSCGDAIPPTAMSSFRLSASCGARHFYRDSCQATCPPGYAGAPATLFCNLDGQWRPAPGTRPTQCTDIDECTAGTDNCQQTCTNAAGSYSCTCRTGFTLDEDRWACTPIQSQEVAFVYNADNPSAVQNYTIPRGVTQVTVRIWGSGGQGSGNIGGTGAYVQAVLPVDAGVVWSIAVGGPAGGLGIPNQSRMDAQNYRGGALVGIFNTSFPHHGSTVAVAGSGGGGGSNACGRGGHGGGLRYAADRMDAYVSDDALADCTGNGGHRSRGGESGGRAGYGTLGQAGRELTGGSFGAYGSGGGAGYWGGGGGGHCPSRCGGGGGGGTSWVSPNAIGDPVIRIAGGMITDVPGRVIISPMA